MSPASELTSPPRKYSASAKDSAVLPLPVGPRITTSKGSVDTSAGTPGNVMPVAGQVVDKNQNADDQDTPGFQLENIMSLQPPRGRTVGLGPDPCHRPILP